MTPVFSSVAPPVTRERIVKKLVCVQWSRMLITEIENNVTQK